MRKKIKVNSTPLFAMQMDGGFAGLSLALVQPGFAKEYWRIVQAEREDLRQWLAWPDKAHDERFFLDFVRQSLHDYADGKSLVCAMLYKGQVVGNVSLNKIDYRRGVAEVGYWLSRDYRGKGIVTHAAAALRDCAFEQYGMEKFQLSVAVDNHASRAVAERLGMTLEGIITCAEALPNRVVDHAVYGCFATEKAAKTRCARIPTA